jgi:hypothetical protein
LSPCCKGIGNPSIRRFTLHGVLQKGTRLTKECLRDTVDRYHANVLAEYIYSQVDNEGYSKSSFDSITDHRSNPEEMSKIPNAKTTKGWAFCVCLKSGDTMWVDLKDLKEANPIELSHYAVANELDQSLL